MLTDTSTYLYLRAHNWWEDQKGQDLVEYALIIALVSIAIVAALGFLAGGIGNVYNSVVSEFGDAATN